jgi:hypothetical protein
LEYKIDSTLKKLGFRQSPLEHGLYSRGTGNSRILVEVYVDDLVIIGGNDEEISGFKRQMKAQFKMSDLGLLSFYLGIEVHQAEGCITLNQAAFAAHIVEKAGLMDCNPSATPMEPKLKLRKKSTAPLVDETAYRSLVGSLRYLVNTRPDLAFSVGYVSRFLERPTDEHLLAVRRIIRFVAGTIHHGCKYVRNGNWKLHGYSDSDLANDVDDRKSTTGAVFFLGDNPVSWQSQKQKVVALSSSSCEAEYIASATATCQGLWLSRLLGDVRNTQAEAVSLMVDNKSALAQIKNPVFHDRSKHIQTRFHFIREAAENGEIKPDYICTGDQLADIFTKPLPGVRFQMLQARFGVGNVRAQA